MKLIQLNKYSKTISGTIGYNNNNCFYYSNRVLIETGRSLQEPPARKGLHFRYVAVSFVGLIAKRAIVGRRRWQNREWSLILELPPKVFDVERYQKERAVLIAWISMLHQSGLYPESEGCVRRGPDQKRCRRRTKPDWAKEPDATRITMFGTKCISYVFGAREIDWVRWLERGWSGQLSPRLTKVDDTRTAMVRGVGSG